ncbi:hypothetical protein B7494_g2103 [Chlorociboria aeruginascens]|nr:hypothetical protein B7494_g2103 [Chlorociboria aeruginascens]
MSLESTLDEERKAVLALLGGTPKKPSLSSLGSGGARAPSPFANPRSPVRSMLDVDDGAPRHGSIAGTNAGISTPARQGPIRSMLDISGSSPPPAKLSSQSAQTSPTEAHHRTALASSQHHRSLSDAASRPADLGPKNSVIPTSAYQFSGYLKSNPGGQIMPKRNTQGGKKVSAISNAMADVVRGGDLTSFGARDGSRHHSIAGTGINTLPKSRSPHNRLAVRSSSPSLDPSKFVLDDGRVIDMTNAYRRLSDANLALSKGGLSGLSEKGRQRRAGSGGTVDSNGPRLEKDYSLVDGEEALDESSEEDVHSSDEERHRGRKKSSRADLDDDPESKTIGMGRAKGPRTALSLMAAAEEERQEIASQQQYKVRSLLEPEITVTGPAGDRVKSPKSGIHPNTSFDTSDLNTPVDSETEADLTDIKGAQKLSINMTSITSTPVTNRCVRTIYRGDFVKMQKEAHDNQRRIRKYLVATDLSDEAAHALEWTIGTVLRDGDTLLAIYCVDEEVGISSMEGSSEEAHMKEQVVAIAASTKPTTSTPVLSATVGPVLAVGNLVLDRPSPSVSASPMGREQGKSEQERYRAVKDITERVSKLLRKTKLQVKVVIEVIHCKSPKHLITEVIDYINPTLVILGSRGRSALKGVILGSFSNYLVTKSSVPVMVARKRLRKANNYKRPSIRLANNLSNPTVKSLASAKID